jgi:hypothetical protein
MDEQKRDKKKYSRNYNQKNHPQGASTSAKLLETTITKVSHTMLPIDPNNTASMRSPLEALMADTLLHLLSCVMDRCGFCELILGLFDGTSLPERECRKW